LGFSAEPSVSRIAGLDMRQGPVENDVVCQVVVGNRKVSVSVAPSVPAGPTVPSDGVAGREGVILFTLAALQVIGIVDFMIIMPLGPQLLEALGIDAMQFSWTVSAYTLAAGIAGFLAAPVLDRVDRKSAYLALSIGLLVSTMACGLATSYPLLLAMRCAAGAFGGLHGAVSLAIVADVFPVEKRGRATSVLMSAFAVASVVGMPIGIALGTRYGWQMPFFALTALGLPLVGMAAWTWPPLAGHLGAARRHPVVELVDTLTVPAHQWAFTLIAMLMFGAFAVIPYISTALVANVGVTAAQLPIVYVVGGLLTLASTPAVGRLVDLYGAFPVFARVVPLSAVMMLVMTHLPAVGLAVAAPVVAVLMASNAGRMVSAMSLIMASIEPRRRGGFMSVNSSVQHIASGLGTMCAGLIVEGDAGEPLQHLGTVGILAATITLASLVIARRVRPFTAVSIRRGSPMEMDRELEGGVLFGNARTVKEESDL
jgi:MFS transporter, DHA1 family, inner membrane transport protein